MGRLASFIYKSIGAFINAVSAPFDIEAAKAMIIGAENTDSEFITPEIAMKQNTVYACVTIIADNIAQLPVHLYKRVRDGRERADDHPLYKILHDQPNSWQTAFEFYQYMTVAMLLSGMACAYIGRMGSRIVSLVPIPPNAVKEVWDGDNHFFNVTFADGSIKSVSPEDIFCVKAFSLDGRYSASPIEYAARTINLGLTSLKHNSKLLGNGATPSGILTTPNNLKKETVDSLRESWHKNYGGENTGRTAVLWGGMEFKPISMSNTDVQLLELMNFQRAEIASFFRVPAYMVGAADKASAWGTGMTELKQSFITFTLAPWLARFQNSISRDLLSPVDRKKYYAEFLTEQFLAANQRERAEVYKVALGSSQGPGWMTVNEVRVKENLPEIAGGDKLYEPITRTGLATSEDDDSEKESAPVEKENKDE